MVQIVNIAICERHFLFFFDISSLFVSVLLVRCDFFFLVARETIALLQAVMYNTVHHSKQGISGGEGG